MILNSTGRIRLSTADRLWIDSGWSWTFRIARVTVHEGEVVPLTSQTLAFGFFCCLFDCLPVRISTSGLHHQTQWKNFFLTRALWFWSAVLHLMLPAHLRSCHEFSLFSRQSGGLPQLKSIWYGLHTALVTRVQCLLEATFWSLLRRGEAFQVLAFFFCSGLLKNYSLLWFG